MIRDLKANCMAQLIYPPTLSIGFRVIGDVNKIPFIADIGPDTRSYYTGGCCLNQLNDDEEKQMHEPKCQVERTTSWTYNGSCNSTCYTFLSIHNIGTQNATFTLVGLPPM